MTGLQIAVTILFLWAVVPPSIWIAFCEITWFIERRRNKTNDIGGDR